MQRTLRLVCQVCDDRGWIEVAPVEDSDGLDYRNVRASRVGTFCPIPCFFCSGGQHV